MINEFQDLFYYSEGDGIMNEFKNTVDDSDKIFSNIVVSHL